VAEVLVETEVAAAQIDPVEAVQEARAVDRAVQAVTIGLRPMAGLRREPGTEIAVTAQPTTMNRREAVVIGQATAAPHRA
jgi:hypothetical protein